MTEQTINILIPAIMALLLFAAFNGLIIKWFNTKGAPARLLTDEAEKLRDRDLRMWSKWWHRCGLAIRVFIWLIVFFITNKDYTISGIVILADWILFPVITNLINNLKWYFVGTTAKTDILIRKMFPFINFDK
jgi:hypothetical protein